MQIIGVLVLYNLLVLIILNYNTTKLQKENTILSKLKYKDGRLTKASMSVHQLKYFNVLFYSIQEQKNNKSNVTFYMSNKTDSKIERP